MVQHVLRLHVAHHDENLVVGHVALVVEVDDRLVRRAVEHLQVSDHRVPDRMDRVDRQVELVGQHVAAVVFVVGQLAADDLQLALELLRLEGDVLHRIGDQLDGGHRVRAGQSMKKVVWSLVV